MLLAGCQKFGGAGKLIRFSAVTVPESQTKTAYSGVLSGGWERIDWSENDLIRIYSDKAVRDNDHDHHWADYKVKTFAVGSDTKMSKADDIAAVTESEMLVWGSGDHAFVGVYPSPGTSDDAEMGKTVPVAFTGTIPSTQTGAMSTKNIYGTADTKIFYPSDASMYLTAYADGQTEAANLTLPFNPAFTAFHINAGTDTDLIISSVTLTAETSPVAGAFTATCDGGWTYSTSSTTKTITLSLGSGYTLDAGQTVDIVLLALPLELTGLTLTFTLSDDSTRSLKLKVNQATNLYGHNLSAGDWIIFDPCNQAYIKGLLIPGWGWTVNGSTTVKMESSVDPWTDKNSSVKYGESTDPVVNAGKLTLSGSNGEFNLYAPKGQQWKITVWDAEEGGNVDTNILFKQKVDGSLNGNEGNGILTGEIGNPDKVEFTLSRSSGSSGTRYLSFSIVIDGVEYSINSEVTRAGRKEITI